MARFTSNLNPDTDNYPNPPQKINTTKIEQFPHRDKYYIIKYGPTMLTNQFLHKDGTWHDHAGPNGTYNTHNEATHTLARHKPQ